MEPPQSQGFFHGRRRLGYNESMSDIHCLTVEEKAAGRTQYLLEDFPHAYGISLGEWPCNRECRMCPMFGNRASVKPRFITPQIFERACAEVGDRPISLEISAYGETYQHPKADEFLFIARRMCPKAHITVATNGTLLNEERCVEIAESGVDTLQLSLDAGSPETYEWLTGSSDYDRVTRNLETLVKTRNRLGAKHLTITTHIIGVKELSHEFDTFTKRWGKVADWATVRRYGNWAGMVDNNGITPAESQNIPAERYPCAWLWYATKIEPDGAVSKCFIHVTGDDNPLGNIMEQSFESIWRGDRIKMLRELHMEGRHSEIEHCGNCIVWSLFPKFWERADGNGASPARWR